MAENKKSFILYADLIGMVEKLPDEVAGKLLKIILQYVNDKNPIVDDLLLQIAFEPIRLQLKRDLVKWDGFKAKQAQNGSLGGRPKKPMPLENNPNNPSLLSESQKSLNVNATVTVNGTVNATVKKDNNAGKIPASILERKELFKTRVIDEFCNNYDGELITEFIGYWTEHNPDGKKMRFEKQTVFDLKRRMQTFENNAKKFSSNGNKRNEQDKRRNEIEQFQQLALLESRGKS